jgi:hypothetical protein
MTNDELMTKYEARILYAHALSQDRLVLRISSVLRHLSFVLRHFDDAN